MPAKPHDMYRRCRVVRSPPAGIFAVQCGDALAVLPLWSREKLFCKKAKTFAHHTSTWDAYFSRRVTNRNAKYTVFVIVMSVRGRATPGSALDAMARRTLRDM